MEEDATDPSAVRGPCTESLLFLLSTPTAGAGVPGRGSLPRAQPMLAHVFLEQALDGLGLLASTQKQFMK